MQRTDGKKRYGADKLALLGLFVISLVLARLIVFSRTSIRLCGLTELKHAGLAVAMPSGNGWYCESRWSYRDDHYDLSSFFAIGSGGVHPQARCRYLLAEKTKTPEELFSRKAAQLQGRIIETGQIEKDALTIHWAHIHEANMITELFVGTVELANNRKLEIEAFQPADEGDLAERAFKRIVGSIEFEDNTLLNSGAELIAQVRDKGLDGILHSDWPYYYDPQVFLLINDEGGRTVGFITDVLTSTGPNDAMNIQAASYQYIRGSAAGEKATLLRSNNKFEEFFLKSESSSRSGRSGCEVMRDGSGVITVREFGARGIPLERKYTPNPAVVPDMLLDLVLIQMLDSGRDRIMLDMIRSDGSVAPVVVSRMDVNNGVSGRQAAYALSIEVLDGREHAREVYLDKDKRILKIIVQQDNTFTLEQADMEKVLRLFPERADYLLHQN